MLYILHAIVLVKQACEIRGLGAGLRKSAPRRQMDLVSINPEARLDATMFDEDVTSDQRCLVVRSLCTKYVETHMAFNSHTIVDYGRDGQWPARLL